MTMFTSIIGVIVDVATADIGNALQALMPSQRVQWHCVSCGNVWDATPEVAFMRCPFCGVPRSYFRRSDPVSGVPGA